MYIKNYLIKKMVSIVILNFNGGDDILECLRSIVSWRKSEQVLVVDNGSSDNSLKEIKQKFKKVEIIENKKNLGFSVGNNEGIKKGLKDGADFIILLNQDVVCEYNFIPGLLQRIKNKPDIGILSPVVKFFKKGREYYDYGGKINPFTLKTYHLNMTYKPKSWSRELDFVNGCSMFIKREVFETVGFLNEDYFFGYEDVDFCLRAKKAGFKVSVCGSEEIIHKGSRAIGFLSSDWIYYWSRNYLLFIKKNFTRTRILLCSPFIVTRVLLFLLSLFVKKQEAISHFFYGIYDFFKGNLKER